MEFPVGEVTKACNTVHDLHQIVFGWEYRASKDNRGRELEGVATMASACTTAEKIMGERQSQPTMLMVTYKKSAQNR